MSEIRLEHVTKRFEDVTAVEDVDFEIRDGELLVLVGPSGCGKTTLLRMITGLDTPTKGDIYLGDERVTDVPARKRDVALVFQNFALFPHLSVRQNISFNLRMQGDLGADAIEDRVREIATMLDIEELLARDIDELSGGQKQRVSLGRAIVTNPDAFMLDEPLANLDANLRDQMETEIVRLQKHLNITSVHVTHNQSEAMTMGDRIAVMNDGAIQQIGEPEDVFYEPANRFVADFIGSPTMNLLDGNYDPDRGVTIEATDGRSLSVPMTTSSEVSDVVVGCRPEHVEVVRGERTGNGWLGADIAFTEFHGASKYLFLELPGLEDVVVRVDSNEGFETDDQISVAFEPTESHLFDPATGERLDARTNARDAVEESARSNDD